MVVTYSDRRGERSEWIDGQLRQVTQTLRARRGRGLRSDEVGREQKKLAAGDGADDEERFCALGDGVGEWGIGGLEREVLFAGEEAEEGTALEGAVVADGSAKHGVTGFNGIEDGAKGDGRWNVENDLGVDVSEVAQVVGELDADHASVWTSTERTAGRSWTMGCQVSPPLGET